MARQSKQPKSLRELSRDVFKTPTGKQLLDELVRQYVHNKAFDKDPYQTAFLAGQRAFVLLLEHYTYSPPVEDLIDDEYLDDRADLSDI